MRPEQVLVFVYNCDRGNLSALKDYSQKPGAEKPPHCKLLAMTSSPVGMKKSWKRFISELAVPARFLHHDEYEGEFGALTSPVPAVFLHSGKTRNLIASAEEINAVLSTEDLIALVRQRLDLALLSS
jgi:hypothetical protein